jgi:UDP-N-acetylglucosamine 2-epimerase
VSVPGIVAAAQRLLDAPRPAAIAFDAHAPYGDGHAGERIAAHMVSFYHSTLRADMPASVPALAL